MWNVKEALNRHLGKEPDELFVCYRSLRVKRTGSSRRASGIIRGCVFGREASVLEEA